MATSKIEWTESTWNPITGCTKISSGCKNCYAERMANRLNLMGNPNYRNGFQLTLHDHALSYPLNWKKPQTIFVNSMSDLFHEDVPEHFIFSVFETIEKASWHKFQILTKRAARLNKLSQILNWPTNLWMGVSVEDDSVVDRIDFLRDVPAYIKFLSIEPLIGPLPIINLENIDWVIVGGESGPKARPMKEEWVIDIKDQCKKQNIPFFFKQWGGTNKKKSGRLLKGKYHNDLPIKAKYA